MSGPGNRVVDAIGALIALFLILGLAASVIGAVVSLLLALS